MLHKTIVRAALAAAALAVLAGVGYAAIPAGDGTITGCTKKVSGVRYLRLIDTATSENCSGGETRLSWNQTGPKGNPGTPGPQGPKGDPGPQGPAGQAGSVTGSALLYLDAFGVTVLNAHQLPGFQVARGGPGVVCFNALPRYPNAVTVTLSAYPGSRLIHAGAEISSWVPSECTQIGYDDAAVYLSDGAGALTDNVKFFVAFH